MHGAAAGLVLVALALASVPIVSGPGQDDRPGAIDGRVTFEGTIPPAILTGEGGTQPVLHVDRSGGVRYAVVFLPDAPPDARPAAGEATMDQRGFVFVPQVLAVRAGQLVRFTSADPANHNVRSQRAGAANTFSLHTAPGSVGPATHRFARTADGVPLVLSCDIHPWMAAWVYVFEHDLFAVTGADGRFRIDRVPPGRHRLSVRQPSGRLARDAGVDVRPGETARVDVRFTAGDVGMPTR